MFTQLDSILLIEDDLNDVLLIKRAFRKAQLQPNITILNDGDAAIAYFKQAALDSSADVKPMLVLLDLKLPCRSGLEVLEWLRNHPQFKRLVVVILTASEEQTDLSRAYELGANSYLVKPIDFGSLIDLVKLIDSYWLKMNRNYHAFYG